MRRAAAALELLIVIIMGLGIYFLCFHNPNGRSDPFAEQTKLKSRQEMVNEKIKEIDNTKAIKERIEKNMGRDQY